jgi:hypothetical protein
MMELKTPVLEMHSVRELLSCPTILNAMQIRIYEAVFPIYLWVRNVICYLGEEHTGSF